MTLPPTKLSQKLKTELHKIYSRATSNSTLVISRVSSQHDSFMVTESSGLRTTFCAENPVHRQSAKHYAAF